MQEIWRDIKGFEGVYQISNYGRLKSFKANRDGRVLSNKNSKGDYLAVVLRNGEKCERHTRIHRLVAEAFMPLTSYIEMEVHHKDENKQNNRIDNLEWIHSTVHHKETLKNNPNMIKRMLDRNKESCIPVLQFTISGELIGEYPNCAVAGLKTGICRRNIQQVAYRTEYKPGKVRKQAGGFVWKLKRGELNEIDCVG